MNIIGNFSTYICEASKAFIILIFLEVIIAPRVQGFKAQNVGMTPTLGLSTVENWGCKINQDLIKKQADLLVSRNLAKAGYDTVLVGCGWYADRRNQDKTMAESTKNFPDKLGKIGDYLHNEKLKFGITQSVGSCQVGIDSYAPAVNAIYNHRDARSMVIQINAWGAQEPQFWPVKDYAHSWRMGADVNTHDTWGNIVRTINQFATYAEFVEPGTFIDLDTIIMGRGNVIATEVATQFSFWCLAKSPIFFSADKDPLGKAISLRRRYDGFDVWSGPLANNNMILKHVGIFNATLQDLWNDEIVEVQNGVYSDSVPNHGVNVYKLSNLILMPPISFRYYSAGDVEHASASDRAGIRQVGTSSEKAGNWIGHKGFFEFHNIDGGKKGGLKVLQIAYIAMDNFLEPAISHGDRFGSVKLNNNDEVVLNFPMSGNNNERVYRDYRVDLGGFLPGETNRIKFSNPKGWAPDIVGIGVQKDA
ncbi:family 27 glycoside hydrolase [Phakopsora pachyrhizi]|nr:family 27 glycoside hydrolase [Phakopsora pachyrhizi]